MLPRRVHSPLTATHTGFVSSVPLYCFSSSGVMGSSLGGLGISLDTLRALTASVSWRVSVPWRWWSRPQVESSRKACHAACIYLIFVGFTTTFTRRELHQNPYQLSTQLHYQAHHQRYDRMSPAPFQHSGNSESSSKASQTHFP